MKELPWQGTEDEIGRSRKMGMVERTHSMRPENSPNEYNPEIKHHSFHQDH
jgi:hypothetical protein